VESGYTVESRVFDDAANGRGFEPCQVVEKAARCVLERDASSHCQLQNHRNKTVVGDVSAKHSEVTAQEQRGMVAVAKSWKSEGMRGRVLASEASDEGLVSESNGEFRATSD
jgi:hypothetical protein